MLLPVICLTAGTSVAALMPEFERLQPITTHFTAPTAVAVDKYECIFIAEAITNTVYIFKVNT